MVILILYSLNMDKKALAGVSKQTCHPIRCFMAICNGGGVERLFFRHDFPCSLSR